MTSRRTDSKTRIALLVVALIPLSLMSVASRLEPNPAGLGTHQQMGLPPCSFRVMLGIRCPGCGMTTSWAHFVRGQWLASMTVNLGGFLLALAGIATTGLFSRSAWMGRLPGIETQRLMTVVVVSITALTIADWLRRLAGW